MSSEHERLGKWGQHLESTWFSGSLSLASAALSSSSSDSSSGELHFLPDVVDAGGSLSYSSTAESIRSSSS